MDTPRIDALEARGPFVVRRNGVDTTLPSPLDMTVAQIVSAMHLEHVPGTPNMPLWLERRVLARWSAHHDLPTLQHLRRLCYIIERYHDAVEFDLQVHAGGTDLAALWRARRFRRLLNFIDHLPRHTWYSEAVANDPEHAQMLAEAMANRPSDDERAEPSPPMHTWTDELAALTEIKDAIRAVNHTLIAVNSEKGKAPAPPKPSPRPKTLLTSLLGPASHQVRQHKHKALAMRMLPHKRAQEAEQAPATMVEAD